MAHSHPWGTHMARRKSARYSEEDTGSDSLLIPQIDLFAILALVGLFYVLVMYPFLNPEPKQLAAERVAVHPVPFYVVLEWPAGHTSDVDLWVSCKTQWAGLAAVTATVGWKSREDLYLVFTHDDLGRPSTLNYEIVETTAAAETLPPNTECTINVHLFQRRDGSLPIEGKVTALHMKDSDTSEKLIADVKFTLTEAAQELTLVSFVTDEKGLPYWDNIETYPHAPAHKIVTISVESGGE